MVLESFSQPFLGPSLGIRNTAAFRGGTSDFLEIGTRNNRNVQTRIHLAVLAVADHQTVVDIVKREALGDRLDRLGQLRLRALDGVLGPLALGDVGEDADHAAARHGCTGGLQDSPAGPGIVRRAGRPVLVLRDPFLELLFRVPLAVVATFGPVFPGPG